MTDSSSPDAFRWQALFQRGRDPIFVLDPRRRLLFANRAWDVLTGRSFAELRGLACTRRKTGAEHSALTHVLCPPPEVLAGQAVCVQRPVPHAVHGPPWWEIDFLPITGDKGLIGIIGRIVPSAPTTAAPTRPLSEAEIDLRNRSADEHRLASLMVANHRII